MAPVLTDSTASFFYYRSSVNPATAPLAYTEVGMGVDGGGNVFLLSGVQNLYGLPVLAVKSSESAEVDAGGAATLPWASLAPSWYVETATPSLETVGYYFASESPNYYFGSPLAPVPGLAGFSSTNTTPLLITGVGQTYNVMGWAKQAILQPATPTGLHTCSNTSIRLM